MPAAEQLGLLVPRAICKSAQEGGCIVAVKSREAKGKKTTGREVCGMPENILTPVACLKRMISLSRGFLLFLLAPAAPGSSVSFLS